MAPYRSREEPRAQKKAPESGLVADMVRQFADVHAFVRELVQNGIDAGAAGIEVLVERGTDGIAIVRVSDDGCGMTLDIVENALLVLFRSTKDEDTTKIGKYGVGFMSVFALEPSEVTVDTWRDGRGHRVRLFPDHSYEIENAAPREQSGTTVTLSKEVAAEDFEGLWQKVAASLHRWCRHAETPIHLTVSDAASAQGPRRARADRAFEVRAAASVRRTFVDMEIVVGPIAGSGALPASGSGEDDPAPFAGFYNRGLTLFETTEALRPDLADVRVKVKSARLQHTLSRDDVRRDQAFVLALARAVAMREADLPGVVQKALLAEVIAVAKGGAGEKLPALLQAATEPPVKVNAFSLPLPLAHPIGGEVALSLHDIHERTSAWREELAKRVLMTTVRTELTAALAALGVPVVWVARGEVAKAIVHTGPPWLAAEPVADSCLVVRELDAKEKLAGDDALCARLSEALADKGVERVTLGAIDSDKGPIGTFVKDAPAGSRSHVVLAVDTLLRSTEWPRGALLVLRADAEVVECARRATSPAIGAQLLARYLLVAGPGLSSKASEAIAVRALEEIR